ncbi:MAG: ATP-dependent Clp protease ATP-binding subunit, partial [Ignavibacteria bacterium]|nr:ATP-dependent Clp protease ATP-binding subunit [Ignavibacteria bacterium]
MNSNYSLTESVKTAIKIAQAYAKEYRQENFSPAHLLKALIHKDVGLAPFLNAIGKDTLYIEDWADVRIETYSKSGKVVEDPIGDKQVGMTFEEGDNVRVKLGIHEINPVCLLAALVKPNIAFTADQLKTFPVLEKEILDLYLSDASVANAVA